MKVRLFAVLSIAVVLALSACAPGAAPAPTPTPGEFPSGEGCDQGPEGTIPMINQDHGYCLRYVDGFTETYPTAEEAVLEGPVPSSGVQPKLFILVTPADGRTTAEVAAALVEEAKPVNPDVTQTEITFAGEQAIVLDGMPGQDISRQVIVVRGERLYHFTYVAWDEIDPSYSQIVDLYNTVQQTFEFH